MTRAEILEYLNDNFECIGTLIKTDGVDFINAYEQCSATGYVDFSFQYNSQSYVFRIYQNIPAQRLYYSIIDMSGDFLQNFMPLIDFDYNLAIIKELNQCEIYHYQGKIYFKAND